MILGTVPALDFFGNERYNKVNKSMSKERKKIYARIKQIYGNSNKNAF